MCARHESRDKAGDNAEIGWIAIMFSDLKGSTELYDALGDVTAYNLVRDHFAFLLDRVQRNHGFVVKTVGDAVMAAFSRPDYAVRAALAIQDDIASFNSAHAVGADFAISFGARLDRLKAVGPRSQY